MIDQAQVDLVAEMLSNSQQPLVVFPPTTDPDLFAASYSLFAFLSLSRDCRLLTPSFDQAPQQALSDYYHPDKVETEMGKENLVISFPYQETQVDKVSYHIGEDGQRFYLTIKPQRGVTPLDSQKVDFSYAGTTSDCIFLCGVEQLEDLKQLYFAYEQLYQPKNTQLVSVASPVPDLGQARFALDEGGAHSQLVFELIKALAQTSNVDLGEFCTLSRASTLLLYGIEHKSRGLQDPTTSPGTFKVVAELLELGAERLFSVTPPARKKPARPSLGKNGRPAEVQLK